MPYLPSQPRAWRPSEMAAYWVVGLLVTCTLLVGGTGSMWWWALMLGATPPWPR